jgi:hypothetical protein
MTTLQTLATTTVSGSVLWVWTIRLNAVTAEFQRFGLSQQTQVRVAAIKIALALSLIASIWVGPLTTPAALGMTFMMGAAQYYHEKHESPISKRYPSGLLLLLCLYIALA